MKKLLVVVDYQKDFVDGSLGFPGAQAIEEPIMCKIEEYRSAGDTIVFTFDAHEKDYLSTQEGKNLPIPHCMQGEEGYELYGRVAEMRKTTDLSFDKSTFGSLELSDWLRECCEQASDKRPFESIEIVGLVLNICILFTAVLAKAACPEVPIIVDAACTDAPTEQLRDATFDVLEGVQVSITNRSSK